jgi:O-antigen ligase
MCLLISASVYLPLSGFDFGEIQRTQVGTGRVFGVLGDSVAFAVALFVCRSFVARRWGTFAFHLGALMLTAGIGGMLTLSVAMLAHLVLPWPGSGRVAPSLRRVASFGVAIVLGLGAIAVFGEMIIQRISGPNLLNVTVAQRYATFQVATEIIREHPFVGVGLRGFNNAAVALAPESLYTAGFSMNFIANAQNQILQSLCDAGILGLTALLLLVAAALALLRNVANSGSADTEAFRAYQVWVIGLAVGNQSAVWLLPFSIIPLLLFTVFGLALAHTWLRNAAMRAQTRAVFVA